MLLLIPYWLYIFCICTICGVAALFLIKKACRIGGEFSPALISCFMAGIVVTTLYAQIFSLFSGVGLIAQGFLLAGCAFILSKKEFRDILTGTLKALRSTLPLWKLLLYLGLFLAFLFFTSRGQEHTDTSTYHALSIHFIEDYGVIKGLGNLMGNIAYNSSWLVFTALFSLKFLSPLSLHGVNGLLAFALAIYALEHVLNFKKHGAHVADLLNIAALFYCTVVACVLQSPATDQPAMLFTLYILIRFAEETENAEHADVSPAKLHTLALLSILAVFTATIKLSAAPLALIVLAPAVLLVRHKNVKNIFIYLGFGILMMLPFIARNFFVSGYIVYPFPSLDVFNVDWKIPLDRVIIDSDQIKTYARTVEMEQITLSVREWLPIWWGNTENYEKLLVIAAFISALGFALLMIKQLLDKKKINLYIVLIFISALVCMLFWLYSAPTVRFGLAYLLVLPAVFLGSFLYPKKEGIITLMLGFIILSVLTCIMPFWNHYVTDDLLFAHHNLKEPYYIVPKDYEHFDSYTIDFYGLEFHRPGNQGKCGYHGFPACMRNPEEVELRGSGVKEGFRGVNP